MKEENRKWFRNSFVIVGESATGTSTTCKALIAELGWSPYRYVYAGAIMRAFAAQHGKTDRQFAEYMSDHPEEGYDKKIDDTVRVMGLQDYVVAEGRMAGYFIPKAMRILLTCDEDERVRRRAGDLGEKDLDLMRRELRRRDTVDHERFLKLYGEKALLKKEDYDLVIDTSFTSINDVVNVILVGHCQWVKTKSNDEFETAIVLPG